ncbi:MAG: methylenetetrahydrofolate reductase C-terminal domain-containing protein [Thermodesulfobacteriota bacterium]
MITAKRKPFEELREMLRPYRRVLIAGCGTCVAECASGGEKEVALLASQLRMEARLRGVELEVGEVTLDRQCVYEFVDQLTPLVRNYEAILSLACGAGVQVVAELYPQATVLPGLDTCFLGKTKEAGIWIENCRGCGQCKLHFFAGVCPIARCAKRLLNGPCGGSMQGHCEVDLEVPCAWQLIVDRLQKQDRLEVLAEIHPPLDWSLKQGRGPRRIQREDQRN